MRRRLETQPRAVLAYGLLGIIPFWSLPIVLVIAPEWVGVALVVELAYAALILSFLGGARWGWAVQAPAPDATEVGLAMLPTLAGLAVLVLMHGQTRAQLIALSAALLLAWIWDLRRKGAPAWYGQLRTVLTFGAVAGLCVSALSLP